MFSSRNFVEKVINSKGYGFNQIVEENIITIVTEVDISFGSYIKHNMHALEWKINAMIIKDNDLIKILDRTKKHPLIRKFSYVPFSIT